MFNDEEDFLAAIRAAGITKKGERLARAVWFALPGIFAARGTATTADVVSIMYRLAQGKAAEINRRVPVVSPPKVSRR